MLCLHCTQVTAYPVPICSGLQWTGSVNEQFPSFTSFKHSGWRSARTTHHWLSSETYSYTGDLTEVLIQCALSIALKGCKVARPLRLCTGFVQLAIGCSTLTLINKNLCTKLYRELHNIKLKQTRLAPGPRRNVWTQWPNRTELYRYHPGITELDWPCFFGGPECWEMATHVAPILKLIFWTKQPSFPKLHSLV